MLAWETPREERKAGAAQGVKAAESRKQKGAEARSPPPSRGWKTGSRGGRPEGQGPREELEEGTGSTGQRSSAGRAGSETPQGLQPGPEALGQPTLPRARVTVTPTTPTPGAAVAPGLDLPGRTTGTCWWCGGQGRPGRAVRAGAGDTAGEAGAQASDPGARRAPRWRPAPAEGAAPGRRPRPGPASAGDGGRGGDACAEAALVRRARAQVPPQVQLGVGTARRWGRPGAGAPAGPAAGRAGAATGGARGRARSPGARGTEEARGPRPTGDASAGRPGR